MNVMLRRAVAVALLFLIAPAAAAAPGPAPAARAPRFEPPVGTPLRYRTEHRVTFVQAGKEIPRETVTTEDELMVVERNNDGFLLRWISTSARVEGPADIQALLAPVVAATLDKPLLIQTDGDGVPLAVLNLDEMRKLLAQSYGAMLAEVPSRFAALPEARREQVRQFFEGFVAAFADIDDAGLDAMLLEQPRRLLGAGGIATAPGRPAAFERRAALPFVGVEVGVVGQIELRDRAPGRTTFAAAGTTRPDDVRRAVADAADQIVGGAPPEARASLAARLRELAAVSLADDLVLTVDDAGVPIEAIYTRRAGTTADGQLDAYRFERRP